MLARVCLRMSQRFLILGPSDTKLDNQSADEIYKESKRLIPIAMKTSDALNLFIVG